MHLRRLFITMAIALTSAGCVSVDRVERRPWYFWGFYNTSDQKISDLRWHYREGKVADSIQRPTVRAGGGASYGPGFAPIPQYVTIEWWTFERGEAIQEIAVAEKIPDLRRFKGTIWLRYDGKGWEAVPMTDEQATQRAINQVKNATVPDPENFP